MSDPLVNASTSKKQIERPGLKAGIDFRSKVKTGVKIDMFGLK